VLYGRIFAGTAAFAAALGGLCWPAGAIPGAGQVQIELLGNMVSYCSNNTTVQQVDVGDLRQPGSVNIALTVDCNAPFQYTMQSQNGAMRLESAPANTPPGAAEVPYNVRMRIPLTLGGAIDDICASAAIRQGAVTCKFTEFRSKDRHQPASGNASLLEWRASILAVRPL
jgi:hypothetical protein